MYLLGTHREFQYGGTGEGLAGLVQGRAPPPAVRHNIIILRNYEVVNAYTSTSTFESRVEVRNLIWYILHARFSRHITLRKMVPGLPWYLKLV